MQPNDTQLTDLQLAIARVLWDKGECTVLEVQNALARERKLAQTTVATLLTRLERRGIVAHRTVGRQFVYRAIITEPEVKGSMVGQLTDMLFSGRPTDLISHLLNSRDVEAGDLSEVKRLIAEAEARAVHAR